MVSKMFDDLNEMIQKAWTYVPKSEAQMQCSYVDDIIEWADTIQSLWDGDNPGALEDRAAQAAEIIEKANEIKELIAGMDEL